MTRSPTAPQLPPTDLLISLVGHQPLPSLLINHVLLPTRTVLVCTEETRPVAERLESLVKGRCEIHCLDDPFHLDKVLHDLAQITIQAGDRITYDLTGGTKPMALGLFNLASLQGSAFLYLNSEGSGGVIHTYSFASRKPLPAYTGPIVVPPDILTLDRFLHAQLGDYQMTGPHKEKGKLSVGGRFEQAVSKELKKACDEVLCGIRPRSGGNQIDIDLVFRKGNRVGLAEVGIAKTDRPKRGLDQLALTSWPRALGIYTASFLILAGELDKQLKKLAAERKVTVVSLTDYFHKATDELSKRDRRKLRAAVRQRLG